MNETYFIDVGVLLFDNSDSAKEMLDKLEEIGIYKKIQMLSEVGDDD